MINECGFAKRDDRKVEVHETGVERTRSEHVFQRSDNNLYDECDDSQHEQPCAVPLDSRDEEEKEKIESRELSRTKRRCAVEELVATEKTYINDLEGVVGGYMERIRNGTVALPKDLKRGKINFVFGNIEDIYKFHRDQFFRRLEKCLEEPEQLGSAFIRCERQMSMYVTYHQNKPYSEYIVSEYDETFFAKIQQQLGHTLGLADYLIRPVQRPMMYKLLLKRILKLSKECGITEGVSDLEKAVEMMHRLPQMSNDMLEIRRLQGFEEDLGKQELLRKGQMLVLDMTPGSLSALIGGPRFKQRRVFLFEQIIIFCEMIDGKTEFSIPTFIFKHSLRVNKTQLHHEGMEPLQFILTTKNEFEGGKSFVLQAHSAEEREEWIHSIEKVLNMQQEILRALESPIAYHSGIADESPSPTTPKSPLPPHMMKRISSMKKKPRKKSSASNTVFYDEVGFSESEKKTEESLVDSSSGSLSDSTCAKKKPFLHEVRSYFRPIKRLLRD